MSDAWHDDRIKEECGVVGLYTTEGEAARLAFFALFALQHRGQESAGIAVSDGSTVKMHKGMGLVSQVFNEEILESLPGNMAIGHNRYSTTGSSVARNAQPIYCTSTVGEIAIGHNGNLINTRELRVEMQAEGEVFDTTADSEIIARLLIRNMNLGVESAVAETMKRLKGAYSVVVQTRNQVIGFRDPYGVRPLVTGRWDGGYIMASESCAFGPVNAKIDREVKPGEMAIIDAEGLRYATVLPAEKPSMCMFEFIYFARPDSRMYGTSLYAARERMGEELAREHPVEADIVIPVPDSGVPAAIGYSKASGLPFEEGMMKSRYIHRTFIQPDQRMREMGVRMKLTPLVDKIEGQRVIVVDDSIVRATTTGQIVKMLFESGAKEVHVRITAPPIKFPCFYGIDMASRGELAAARWTLDEIKEHLGATSLGYLSIPGVVKAAQADKNGFCLACFDGKYPIPVPENLSKLAFEDPPEVGQMGVVSSGQLKLIDVD